MKNANRLLIQISLLIAAALLIPSAAAADADQDYREGVEAYLNGEMDLAYEKLKSVLDEDPSHSRANQLFKKVISEVKKPEPQGEQTQKAESRVSSSAFVPVPPKNISQVPPAPPGSSAAKTRLPEKKKEPIKASAPKTKPKLPASRAKEAPVQKKTALAKASAPETKEPQNKPDNEISRELKTASLFQKAGGPNVLLLTMGLIMAGGLLFMFWFAIMQARHIKQIEKKNESLHADLQNLKDKNFEIQKSLEIEREAERRAEQRFHEWQKKQAPKEPVKNTPAAWRVPSKAAGPALPKAPPPAQPPAPAPAASSPYGTAESGAAQPKIFEALVDLPNVKKRHLIDQLSREMEEIHRLNPEEALSTFQTLAQDSRPMIRTAAAGALGLIATEECVSLLLDLHLDQDPSVQREALKQLKALQLKEGLSETLKSKIETSLQEEKEKGEWVF